MSRYSGLNLCLTCHSLDCLNWPLQRKRGKGGDPRVIKHGWLRNKMMYFPLYLRQQRTPFAARHWSKLTTYYDEHIWCSGAMGWQKTWPVSLQAPSAGKGKGKEKPATLKTFPCVFSGWNDICSSTYVGLSANNLCTPSYLQFQWIILIFHLKMAA